MRLCKSHSSLPAASSKVGCMANILRAEKRIAVLHQLVEGSSVRSTERLTGVHRDTILRAMVRAGDQCEKFMDRTLRNLPLEHVQLDEQWTFVGIKNGRIPVEERRSAFAIGDQYLFLGIDEETKLIPSWLIGKRTADNCRRFLIDLAERLVWNRPHASDDHAFRRPTIEPLTRLSSDQWAGYPEAIDLAFGGRVQYGQLRKDFRNRQQPGNYAPGELVGADRRVVFGDFDPRTVCTSHVERQNANTRLFLRRFSRLTLAFSKKLANLKAAVALYVAHHNYCRVHRTLRMTPAMKAGLAGHPWRMEELLSQISQAT